MKTIEFADPGVPFDEVCEHHFVASDEERKAVEWLLDTLARVEVKGATNATRAKLARELIVRIVEHNDRLHNEIHSLENEIHSLEAAIGFAASRGAVN